MQKEEILPLISRGRIHMRVFRIRWRLGAVLLVPAASTVQHTSIADKSDGFHHTARYGRDAARSRDRSPRRRTFLVSAEFPRCATGVMPLPRGFG